MYIMNLDGHYIILGTVSILNVQQIFFFFNRKLLGRGNIFTSLGFETLWLMS